LFMFGWTIDFLSQAALALGTKIIGEAARAVPAKSAFFTNCLLEMLAILSSSFQGRPAGIPPPQIFHLGPISIICGL